MEDKKLLKSYEKHLLNLNELGSVSGGVGSVGTICPKCGQPIVNYKGYPECGCIEGEGDIYNTFCDIDPYNRNQPSDEDPYGLAPVK